ncbi:YacP protein [Spatholobus suberectus]|nr:YacP protein [Spatholobus suberectus]
MKLKTVPSSCNSLVLTPGLGDCNYNASSSSSSTRTHRHRQRQSIIVVAKSKKQQQQQQTQGSESTPPRITSNVKQNLRFLRLWKSFQIGNSSTLRPSTSYRKKKVEKEGVVDTDELYRDPTTSLYYTNQQGIDNAVPVLLVDGYNVCGYWMKLKKHFMKGRLDIARQKLIDELVTFSMLREVKVVVVFDAMMSGLPTHKEDFAGTQVYVWMRIYHTEWAPPNRQEVSVDIIFSGETCADTWIEKEVAALKEDGCPKVWVVTSDHCQQQAAHGAGAFVWSCKALVTEIKASQKEVERMLQEQRSTSFQGRLLKHNLDAEVVDALKNLRQKLSENELK